MPSGGRLHHEVAKDTKGRNRPAAERQHPLPSGGNADRDDAADGKALDDPRAARINPMSSADARQGWEPQMDADGHRCRQAPPRPFSASVGDLVV